MATNSTLLAIQCAAGVAAPPRCLQLRKNLITKTHKTTIMAANPALQYEGGVSIFIPYGLHRNAVSPKRNKIIVAAQQTIAGNLPCKTPEKTVGKIMNKSGETISLEGKDSWSGSEDVPFPLTVDDQTEGDFTHNAKSEDGTSIGSIAGLEYRMDDGTKWIIAWSNPLSDLSKVYTEILQSTVDWEEIKTSLETKGGKGHAAVDFGYLAELDIDAASNSPNLIAKISPSPCQEA